MLTILTHQNWKMNSRRCILPKYETEVAATGNGNCWSTCLHLRANIFSLPDSGYQNPARWNAELVSLGLSGLGWEYNSTHGLWSIFVAMSRGNGHAICQWGYNGIQVTSSRHGHFTNTLIACSIVFHPADSGRDAVPTECGVPWQRRVKLAWDFPVPTCSTCPNLWEISVPGTCPASSKREAAAGTCLGTWSSFRERLDEFQQVQCRSELEVPSKTMHPARCLPDFEQEGGTNLRVSWFVTEALLFTTSHYEPYFYHNHYGL